MSPRRLGEQTFQLAAARFPRSFGLMCTCARAFGRSRTDGSPAYNVEAAKIFLHGGILQPKMHRSLFARFFCNVCKLCKMVESNRVLYTSVMTCNKNRFIAKH
jgi:hypothetical protein